MNLPGTIPITLTVSLSDAGLLMDGLAHLPLKDSLLTFQKVRDQVDEQVREWVATSKPVAE